MLCIGIAACMMCGCGILPTEEEFDAAPLVKEYSDENVGKYTVTRGDMIQSESIAVRYEGTKKSDVYGTDDGIRIKAGKNKKARLRNCVFPKGST